MKGRITVINPSLPAPTIIERDGPIPLGELQSIVGGYIELVPYWNSIKLDDNAPRVPCHVFCNEDGKGLQLPHNWIADRLWVQAIRADYGAAHTPGGDFLVGPVAIVTGDAEFLAEL